MTLQIRYPRTYTLKVSSWQPPHRLNQITQAWTRLIIHITSIHRIQIKTSAVKSCARPSSAIAQWSTNDRTSSKNSKNKHRGINNINNRTSDTKVVEERNRLVKEIAISQCFSLKGKSKNSSQHILNESQARPNLLVSIVIRKILLLSTSRARGLPTTRYQRAFNRRTEFMTGHSRRSIEPQ